MSRCAYQTSSIGTARIRASSRGMSASRAGRSGPSRRRDLVLAPCHLEAGGQALDIPLPRGRRRLVEVVDVEHQASLGRPERAEVRQMRIAARLHEQGPCSASREVRGHRRRGAAEVGERRDQHAPMPDRDEVWRSARRPAPRAGRPDRSDLLAAPRWRGLIEGHRRARPVHARRVPRATGARPGASSSSNHHAEPRSAVGSLRLGPLVSVAIARAG